MGNLDDAIKKHAKRLGIDRQVEAVGIVEKAQKEITKYISEEDFEVISYNRGTLKIKVVSSVVANELQMKNKELKDKLDYKSLRIIN